MNVKNWVVCLIEPNKYERKIIEDLLKNAGVEKLRSWGDAAEALSALEVYPANIVIASFELGEEDGAAWTRAYRRNRKLPGRKAAIFITSGAFSRAMAEQCRHAGANALIGKPISSKVLTSTISKVLSQPRPFIDAEGYVGPCRRAGIVTAGEPKKRRKADVEPQAGGAATLRSKVEALAADAAKYARDPRQREACEAALRHVQAYAVNAGDGPMMRACAAFALQLDTKNLRSDMTAAAVDACVNGIARLAALPADKAAERDAIAEQVRKAVAHAAMHRAA